MNKDLAYLQRKSDDLIDPDKGDLGFQYPHETKFGREATGYGYI